MKIDGLYQRNLSDARIELRRSIVQGFMQAFFRPFCSPGNVSISMVNRADEMRPYRIAGILVCPLIGAGSTLPYASTGHVRLRLEQERACYAISI